MSQTESIVFIILLSLGCFTSRWRGLGLSGVPIMLDVVRSRKDDEKLNFVLLPEKCIIFSAGQKHLI